VPFATDNAHLVRLRGRVALVVGGSGGIGSATVRMLHRGGAHVVLAGLPDASLERLQRELDGSVLVVPVDVKNRAEIDRLVARTLVHFGRLDILVNAAGVASRPSLAEETDADLEHVVAVNLLGCARTIQAVMPIMKAQRRGAIVVIGSVAGEIGVMGMYSATKFGLRGLCDSVRREVRQDGVSVTLIEPGFVQTAMNPPTPRLPSPDLVAQAVTRALRRPRRTMIVPRAYVGAVFLARLLPGFMDFVVGHTAVQQHLNGNGRAHKP